MDINFETTPGDVQAASAFARPEGKTAVAENDPRLLALCDAGKTLIAAAGLADTDTVEVSLAMSDEPGWAVVRVARIIREP